MFKLRIGASLVALSMAAAAMPASAQDGLTGRAVTALGIAIASQGDAALVQIRAELKDTLLQRIEPYLPKPEAVPAPTPVSVPATPVVPGDGRTH